MNTPDLTLNNVGQAVIRGLFRLKQQAEANPDFDGPPVNDSDNDGRRILGLQDVRFQVNIDGAKVQVIIEGADPGERPDVVAAIGEAITEDWPHVNVLVGTEPYRGQLGNVEVYSVPAPFVIPELEAIRQDAKRPHGQRRYITSV